jgi:hypothetical protein
MTDPTDPTPHPVEYYRQKATQARKAAEGVTTPRIKTRLLDLARDFDRQAKALEGAGRRR